MSMRMTTWLSAVALAGCVVQPAPRPQYQPPPAEYAQQDPDQAPPPGEPTAETYPPPPPADSPPPADGYPPPETYGEPVYSDLDVEVSGNDVPSVDVFYDQL